MVEREGEHGGQAGLRRLDRELWEAIIVGQVPNRDCLARVIRLQTGPLLEADCSFSY